MVKTFQLSGETWEALLKPLDGDNPCGTFLLYDPLYDDIRDARTHEEDNLPQGIWKRDLKKADWSLVEDLCIKALSEKTKDLQIAVWLSEAWLQLYGLKGFAQGIELIHRLASTFWDTIYPELKKDDPEYRLAPFFWLDDKLIERLNLLVVTDPTDKGVKQYHFEDWQRAQQQEQVRKRTQAAGRVESPSISLATLRNSQRLTPTSFYKDMRRHVRKCLEELQALETVVASHESNYPGISSHLRTQLQSILAFVDVILKSRHQSLEDSTSDEIPTDAGSLPSSQTDKITSRDQAYQRLAEAADFLAQLEPHSPTPYLVKRAITWGSMPLVDLLKEIVNDPNDYRQIMQLLGQQPKNGNGNGNGATQGS